VSDPPPTPLELGHTLDGTLGVEWLEASDEAARARIPVADKLKQPMGLVHGGVFAALAESLASAATYLAVREDGMVAMGMANQTTFMRPITEGIIHGEARRRHRGRTTWLWDVEITDDDGRLCALSRVTMAVRPARPG
jgi:1,4-dihydroxy-2-naphthoyl-CoA hydrolase